MSGIGLFAVVISFVFGVLYDSLFGAGFLEAAFLAVLTFSLLAASVLTRRLTYVIVLLAVVAFGGGAARTAVMLTELPPSFVPLVDTSVNLKGVVVTQPDAREESTRLMVEVMENDTRTRIIAVAPPHGAYAVGDRVTVRGTLRLPEPFETPGGRIFAYDAFLAKDGVFALVQPARVEVTSRDERLHLTVLRHLQLVRDGFISALGRALPDPESALAAGLIAGGKQGLGKELLDVFTTAGLIHIVVLSGYNVMIVAEAILRGLGFLSRKYAAASAGIAIALFVLAAGAGAAALRAGLMALLGLVARATGRTYAVVRALFVALLAMLLWNPLLLVHDPGFQFSFVATLGLILFASHLERLFMWMPGFLREVAASTFAAQIAVLPILLFHTGNLSLVSFVVNLFVLPVLPAAMGFASVSGFVALIMPGSLEPLVLLVGLPAYALLAYVIRAAEFAASLPLAQVTVPAFSFWVVALAYALLASGYLYIERARAPARARSMRNL